MIDAVYICDTLLVTDDQVDKALRSYRRAEATLDRRRQDLADAIGSAVVDRGLRQVDVARQTGYTREHIRRICRDYVDRKIGQSATPL